MLQKVLKRFPSVVTLEGEGLYPAICETVFGFDGGPVEDSFDQPERNSVGTLIVPSQVVTPVENEQPSLLLPKPIFACLREFGTLDLGVFALVCASEDTSTWRSSTPALKTVRKLFVEIWNGSIPSATTPNDTLHVIRELMVLFPILDHLVVTATFDEYGVSDGVMRFGMLLGTLLSVVRPTCVVELRVVSYSKQLRPTLLAESHKENWPRSLRDWDCARPSKIVDGVHNVACVI
ncbi:hypothetical protein HDU93_002720, partial [Gonapodya sp. JEL0774]